MELTNKRTYIAEYPKAVKWPEEWIMDQYQYNITTHADDSLAACCHKGSIGAESEEEAFRILVSQSWPFGLKDIQIRKEENGGFNKWIY